jgi:hypothetical protein
MSQRPYSICLIDAVSVVLSRVVAWVMAIALAVFLSASPSAAQASAEYGHLATGGGAAASSGLTTLSKKLDSAPSPTKSSFNAIIEPDAHMAAATPSDKSIQDANRSALERHAGQNAAKLSFKSVPAKAVVRIDGKPVGETPLLMSLAPGNYKIEMEGPRMEFGKQQLIVGAKDEREVDLHLSAAPRYPSRIRLD